ncbi:hypothetical protein N7486_008646 [Penicillium sp. IBT 16267x]|nr:hypothetical protein N7486_008646 [Penicillium sp. IBT 16267x]
MSSPIITPSKQATRAKAPSSKPATPKTPRDAEASDNRVLANVLKSFDPEVKKIDLNEFAALMGYTNVRSAGNTFNRLRKAHALKVEGFMTRSKDSAKITKPGNGTKTRLNQEVDIEADDDNLPLSDDDDVLDVPDKEPSNEDITNVEDEL